MRLFLVAFSLAAFGQTPQAIFTDPPHDAAHPATMSVEHIPSHGIAINSVVYQAAGAGLHPTLVICHGLPGNEKNLDLAQAVRRAGWNAVTFNYRGSWGSPGSFRFAQNLEDANAVLAYFRDPKTAARLQVDTTKIVLAGHSMGGWVTVHTAAHDPGLKGVILISAWDAGKAGATTPAEKLEAEMAEDMESLAGTNPKTMARELIVNAKQFSFAKVAEALRKTPILALTADDGLADDTNALVKAIGGTKVTLKHAATDHSWSDRRIELESLILNWLGGLK